MKGIEARQLFHLRQIALVQDLVVVSLSKVTLKLNRDVPDLYCAFRVLCLPLAHGQLAVRDVLLEHIGGEALVEHRHVGCGPAIGVVLGRCAAVAGEVVFDVLAVAQGGWHYGE